VGRNGLDAPSPFPAPTPLELPGPGGGCIWPFRSDLVLSNGCDHPGDMEMLSETLRGVVGEAGGEDLRDDAWDDGSTVSLQA